MEYLFAKSSWAVLDDAATERSDIRGFCSTVGYNATPYYRLLGSLHVIEIFKKLGAENIMIPPICDIGSPSCGDLENCYFSSW